MAYDDAIYNVPHMIGPIFASFASGIKSTTANKTATTVNVSSRIQFFRSIKLTNIQAITQTSGAATGHALSELTPKFIVTEGTRVCATCVVATVAGVGTFGGISATYATITSGETVKVKLKIDPDGTVTTTDDISANIWLEYQHVM